MLLANECSKTGVSIRRSTIQHEKAGNGVFSSRNFGEKGVVGSYYGSLAYADLEES